MGIPDDDGDPVKIHSKLNQMLVREYRKGKRFVLIVDEAQNLDNSVLEVVRMLSNFENSAQKLIQIILSGQPQLARKLASPEMLQLRQRLSMVARLKPFSFDETSLYIDHRLRTAGYDFRYPLFTPPAIALITSASEGIPRNINNICFNSLLLGRALERQEITRQMVSDVLADLDLYSLLEEDLAGLSEADAGDGANSKRQSRVQVERQPLEHQPLEHQRLDREHLSSEPVGVVQTSDPLGVEIP